MSTTGRSAAPKKILIGAAVVAVATVGGYFARGALFGTPADRDLISGDSARVVEALTKIDNEQLASDGKAEARAQAIATLREAPIDTVFDRLHSDDLSDEDRERLEGNLRALMMEDMARRVDEYHAAAEEEKEAVLDRHIDEMIAFRDKMRAYREKHKDELDGDEGRGPRWGPQRSFTKEDRKKRMEGGNPDQFARMMQYWPKVMARAKARGIEFGRLQRGG